MQKCGAKLQDGAKFCQKCGTPTVLPPTETPVSQWEQPVHPGPSEPRAVPPAPVPLQQPYAARPFQSPQGRQEASQIPRVPVQPGNPQATPPPPGTQGSVPPSGTIPIPLGQLLLPTAWWASGLCTAWDTAKEETCPLALGCLRYFHCDSRTYGGVSDEQQR